MTQQTAGVSHLPDRLQPLAVLPGELPVHLLLHHVLNGQVQALCVADKDPRGFSQSALTRRGEESPSGSPSSHQTRDSRQEDTHHQADHRPDPAPPVPRDEELLVRPLAQQTPEHWSDDFLQIQPRVSPSLGGGVSSLHFPTETYIMYYIKIVPSSFAVCCGSADVIILSCVECQTSLGHVESAEIQSSKTQRISSDISYSRIIGMRSEFDNISHLTRYQSSKLHLSLAKLSFSEVQTDPFRLEQYKVRRSCVTLRHDLSRLTLAGPK